MRRFWREITPATSGAALTAPAATEATLAVLRLKYLDGGHGEGCNNADDAFTLSRRRAHHLTFYGFLLCFAATLSATVYHYLLGWSAPYELNSLPKLLAQPVASVCCWARSVCSGSTYDVIRYTATPRKSRWTWVLSLCCS